MDDRTPQGPAAIPWRAVYGADDGRWFKLTGPPGVDPPSTVEGLAYLGTPTELITLVCDRWQAEGAYRQARLGALLTVSQQTACRYQRGEPVSDLSAQGWRGLVSEVFATGGPLRCQGAPM